jgi:branched-chain amino acid transport system ATP-binding protein
MMLRVENIHTYYGLSHILFDVSLEIKKGQVVCLLGRNGAGKTTTLKSIMGLNPPKQGAITFKGQQINGIEPFKLVRQGFGYVPDDRRIFADLTVGENLDIAMRKERLHGNWNKERVYEFFPALKDMDTRKGGLLSGGEQKMLAIARALMGNPELILLDEPTEGLAPMLVDQIQERIARLKATGLTVLLAEQNVKFTLGLSDYGYIIDNGRICYQGVVEDLLKDEAVRRTCGI